MAHIWQLLFVMVQRLPELAVRTAVRPWAVGDVEWKSESPASGVSYDRRPYDGYHAKAL